MRRTKAMGILIALSVFAAACGNGNDASVPDSSKSSQTIAKDPFGKYDQTIALNIAKNYDTRNLKLPNGDSLENNEFSRYIKNTLNVDVKMAWQTETGEAYGQKVGVAISSRDLPDAFIVNESQLKQLVKAKLVADLTDVYKDFASPLIKGYYESYGDRVLNRATLDGKLYALPDTQIAGQHALTWIRQDWLDKLGLKPPTTVAELEAVAKAFIDQDPDGNGQKDTIGFTTVPSLSGWNTAHSLDPIFGAYNAYKGQFLKDASGNVVYSSTLPEMKKALSELQKMYKDGIIDKEFAVRKSPDELIAGNKAGIMFGPWWMPYGPLADSVKNDSKAEWKPYSLPLDSEGKYNIYDQDPTANFLVVNKNYTNPEAVMKVLNLQTEGIRQLDPGSKDIYKGLGVPWNVWPFSLQVDGENGAYDIYLKVKKALDAKDPSGLNDELKGYYDNYLKNKGNPKKDIVAWSDAVARIDGTAQIGSDKIHIVRNEFFGQTATMQRKWSILTKLENETFLKIIMGEESVDQFDNFVTEWKKIGGDDVLKEINEELNVK